MSKFHYLKRGEARITIKTHAMAGLPTFELDLNFTKDDALKVMVYALQLYGHSRPPNNKEKE